MVKDAENNIGKTKPKKYEKAAVLNLPDYLTELHTYDIELSNSKYDLIFAFMLEMESLKATISKVIEENYLNKNGYIFLAYPKKGNNVYSTFIYRDDLMDGLGADEKGCLGTSDIKFARMVGLDDVFRVVGLKEETRNTKNTSTKTSQCVNDYIKMIPNIEKDLQDTPELLVFFQLLTPGYRKEWARYVYSANQEATKAKRREEMKMILGAGYKSRDLYRRNKS